MAVSIFYCFNTLLNNFLAAGYAPTVSPAKSHRPCGRNSGFAAVFFDDGVYLSASVNTGNRKSNSERRIK
jgi:hypothetical protein